MILCDYHTHTTFCDGKSSPEEMVISAINKGLNEIGILTHSATFFDNSYCIPYEKYPEFIDEINRLKEEYGHKIKILCGVEQDYYSDTPTDGFDYVIGSAHYLSKGEKYYSLDSCSEWMTDFVNEVYDGDFYLMAEDYFSVVADIANKTNADIIGHFDLITKFNEKDFLFDHTKERYLTAAKSCIDKLIPFEKPFEINTGAISRGYRTTPYPSTELIDYIKQKGGKLILSSDAHHSENIAFQFDNWEKLL